MAILGSRSGKDEFVKQCQQINIVVLNISTVDFVKRIAKECGWDGTKTAANRKFLSDLKALLIEWDDVPFKQIERELIEFEHTCESYDIPEKDRVAFIHCREPEEIQKFVDRLDAVTLRIVRPDVDGGNQSNASDANIGNYQYDYTVYNDGTLDDLHVKAAEFLEVLAEN